MIRVKLTRVYCAAVCGIHVGRAPADQNRFFPRESLPENSQREKQQRQGNPQQIGGFDIGVGQWLLRLKITVPYKLMNSTVGIQHA